MQQDLSDDENNEDDAESFSQDFSCQTSGSNSDYININSVDTDAEAQSRPAGQRQQQRPQSFYKQPPCVLSPAAAFEHLVKFVQQLPAHIVSDKAAAHLRTFASRKVLNKSDLSSAARKIWLAVHPDKNCSAVAQEVTTALGGLLDSLKAKGAL